MVKIDIEFEKLCKQNDLELSDMFLRKFSLPYPM